MFSLYATKALAIVLPPPTATPTPIPGTCSQVSGGWRCSLPGFKNVTYGTQDFCNSVCTPLTPTPTFPPSFAQLGELCSPGRTNCASGLICSNFDQYGYGKCASTSSAPTPTPPPCAFRCGTSVCNTCSDGTLICNTTDLSTCPTPTPVPVTILKWQQIAVCPVSNAASGTACNTNQDCENKDNNSCISSFCNSGQCVNFKTPAGAPCGNGGTGSCNGNGTCIAPAPTAAPTSASCSKSVTQPVSSCNKVGKGTYCAAPNGNILTCDGLVSCSESPSLVLSCCGFAKGTPCSLNGQAGVCNSDNGTCTAPTSPAPATSGTFATCPLSNPVFSCAVASPNSSCSRLYLPGQTANCAATESCWNCPQSTSQCVTSDCGLCAVGSSCQQVANVSTKSCSCQPNGTSSLTPTVVPGSVQLALALAQEGLTSAPVNRGRSVTVVLLGTDDQIITKTGTADYSNGTFNGTINLGVLPSGSYKLKVKVGNFLRSPIIKISISGTAVSAQTTAVAGLAIDQNNDNIDAISFYANGLRTCFGSTLGVKKCDKPEDVDLNGDGNVDVIDYQIYLKGIRNLRLGLPVQ